MFDNLISTLEEKERNRTLGTFDFKQVFNAPWHSEYEDMVRVGTRLITYHAFTQLCKKLAYDLNKPVTPRYIWAHPEAISAMPQTHVQSQIVAFEKRDNLTKQNNIVLNIHKAIVDGAITEVITGVLSTNYCGISNLQVLTEFLDAVNFQELTIKDFDVVFDSEDFCDTMILTVIFEEFRDRGNYYGAGVQIRNSQNGKMGLTVSPIMKATVCNNSIIHMSTRYHKHLVGVDSFYTESLMELKTLIDTAVTLFTNTLVLKDIPLEDDEVSDKMLLFILSKFKLAAKLLPTFRAGVSSEHDEISVYSVVAAITYLATQIDDHLASFNLSKFASYLTELVVLDRSAQGSEYVFNIENYLE